MSIEKIVSKKVDVQLGESTITVSKLPLGEYAGLILALKNLPSGALKDIQGIDTSNEEESIQALIGLIGSSWGSILEIISIGSGMDKDTIENDPAIGLDGGIALFLAIYEVNNLESVFQKVKSRFSRPAE